MIVHAKGKASLTTYEVLETFGLFSLVQFQIHTGRTHQIRVHTADAGHPVAVDPLYGDGKPSIVVVDQAKIQTLQKCRGDRKAHPVGRLALHAWKIGLHGSRRTSLGDSGAFAKGYERPVATTPQVAETLNGFDKPHRYRIIAKLIDEDKRPVRRVIRVPVQEECLGPL